jgi:hypothetical protein
MKAEKNEMPKPLNVAAESIAKKAEAGVKLGIWLAISLF